MTASVLVVDASVAAKWVFPAKTEPLSEQAENLFHAYRRGEIEIVVPDLFWSEIASFLWKGVRRKQISTQTAEQGLQAMTSHDLPTVPARKVLPRALSIAVDFDRSVYDSIYVALAIDQRASLVTADEKLANALAAYFPVKWLGIIY